MTPAEPTTFSRARSSAFTMLELLAVVILIGLVAGIALVSVRSPLRRASVERCLSRLAEVDAAERAAAMRSPTPGRLQFDAPENSWESKLTRKATSLPRGWSARRFACWDGRQWGNVDGVDFFQNGQSATYLIELADESSPDRAIRVLVTGIGGQFNRLGENTP